jgi:hypothetical protein
MDLETFWYEAFPYLYGVGGVVALVFAGHSILLKGSGILLIIASITIIRLRRAYRRNEISRMTTAAEVARMPVRDDD